MKTYKLIELLLIATLAGGCAAKRGKFDEFAPGTERTDHTNVLNAQAANGARADATLRASHFDGAKLNSLGLAKLDLMTKADDQASLTVWLDLAKDDPNLADRKSAVGQCLKDHGLTESSFVIALGPNPASKAYAAPSIANLSKTESTTDSGSTGGASAATAPPSK